MKKVSLHGLIRDAGLSLEAVSEWLMIPVSEVENWVLWKTVPTVTECIQLAELLEVDLPTIYLSLLKP